MHMTASEDSRSPEELTAQVRFLEAEVTDLRRRLADGPAQSRLLDQRLADTQRSLAAVTSQHEQLAQTLRAARDQILTPPEEVDRPARRSQARHPGGGQQRRAHPRPPGCPRAPA